MQRPPLLLSVLAAGCVGSASVTCPDGSTCPSGARCVTIEADVVCVAPAQEQACRDRTDGTSCTTPDLAGVCRGGACIELETCTYVGQQIEVPLIAATYLAAHDDAPHATEPHVWITQTRTTLLDFAIGDNAISALALFLAQVPADRCDEPCTHAQGVMRASRLLVPWTADATWTHRTANDGWAEPGIGAGEREQLSSFGNLAVMTANIPITSMPSTERHVVTLVLSATTPLLATYARSGGGAIAARATCLRGAACGNGIVDAGEQCDGSELCSTQCTIENCGNGFREGVEACDDGNASNNDRCLTNCESARCGDGLVANEGGGQEQCDQGTANGAGCCSINCTGSCP